MEEQVNKKLTEKQKRSELIKELKGYRKSDKNTRLYEQFYHKMFGTNLKSMPLSQLNDMILFIINNQISYENAYSRLKTV